MTTGPLLRSGNTGRTRALGPLFVLMLCTALPEASTAQRVLGSAGAHFAAGDLSVAWTIGEPIVATGSGADAIVTQGFHQPPTDLTTVMAPVPAGLDLRLFPNPTRGMLQLITSSTAVHHGEVLDALGRRIALWPINASLTAWDVSGLADGTYLLRVFDRDHIALHTFSFILAQ